MQPRHVTLAHCTLMGCRYWNVASYCVLHVRHAAHVPVPTVLVRAVRGKIGQAERAGGIQDRGCRDPVLKHGPWRASEVSQATLPPVPVTGIAGTCWNVLPERCDPGRLNVFQ